MNCTQFCSERPQSECLGLIHNNFLSIITSRFHKELRDSLLEEEDALLADLSSLGVGGTDSALNEEIASVRSQIGAFLRKGQGFLPDKRENRLSHSPDEQGLLPGFSQFYLALTNRCNLKCIMCSTTRHAHELEEELSLHQWIGIIRNITRFPVEVITFGGGEPLLRETDLSALIRLAAEKSTVNIVTNGTLLTEYFLNSIDDLREKVIFLVSCDGLEAENDSIRGKGTFARIFASVDLLKKRGFKIFITSVLMPENFSGFTGFLEYLNRNYSDLSLDIQPVIPHNEVYHRRKDFSLSPLEFSMLQKALDYLHSFNRLQLCRPLSVIDRYVDYFRGTLKTRKQCGMGTKAFNINLRGNIWICGKEIESPLYSHDLEEILNSGEYRSKMTRVRKCDSPCLAGLVI